MVGVGGDGDQGVAAIQFLIAEPAILPAGHQRHGTLRTSSHQFGRRFSWAHNGALGAAGPGRHGGDKDAVLDRVGEIVVQGDPGYKIGGVMGDALDAPRIEDRRLHQSHLSDAEIAGQSDRPGNIDDVLGTNQDQNR